MPSSPHGRLASRFQGGEFNFINPSISDLLGNSIWIESEKKVGKKVIIEFLAAVAKEHNCGSINSAQRSSRTAKSALKPRGKLGPKSSTKRKRTETEVKTLNS